MKHLFLLFIISLLFIGGIDAKPKTTEHPNVVFIICDDLNDAIHGMGGHPQAKTPCLDKLADNGVRFTNAQTNCPLCGPSRASLWSGLSPQTTGYFGYKQQANHWRNNPMLKNTITVFEHFTNNGYNVFATGKIHHNGHHDYSIFKNADGTSGFKVIDSFGPYPWDGDPAKKIEKIRGVSHPDMHPEVQKENWHSGYGPIRNLSNDFDGGTWLYTHNGEEFKIQDQEHRDLTPDERCAEYATEVLNQKHDKPFLLAVGFNQPHTPLYAPQKYFDMFPLDSLRLSPFLEGDLDDCAEALWKDKDISAHGFAKYKKLKNIGGEKLLLEWTQAYLACVASVDDQIGKVIEAIEKSEYANNTLVIVTSDHGYHMAEKEYIFKNSVWEESTRVPLIVAGLSTQKGSECTHPVSLIDMYPTLIDVCNLPHNPNKKGNRKALDGHSIVPFLANPLNGEWDGDDFAITAVASKEVLKVDEPGKVEEQHYSIRTERYRYIICRNGEEELYDHYYDPYEWFNLASDKAYSEIIQSMRKKVPYAVTNN